MIDFSSMRHVALFSHVRPDGDTLGAMFGLRAALTELGVRSDCFCDSPVADELLFLDCDAVLNKKTPASYDACIALDCADASRMGKYVRNFFSVKNNFNIDHHGTNPGYARVNIVRESASTCEIVYDLLREAGIPIQSIAATCLYSGIVTDTGSFSQNNTTAHSHFVAAELIKIGVDVEGLHNRLMKVVKRQKLLFIADRIQALRSFGDGRISVMTVSIGDLKRFGLDGTDTEGLINYALNIDGVDIAASITEFGMNQYKVSLRCRSGYDVSEVAKAFGGGGHVQAGGCQINAVLEEAVERIVRQSEIALEKHDRRHR